MNFNSRINELNNDQQHNNNNNSNSNNLFNNDHNKHSFPLSPMMGNNYTEISRLRDELAGKQAYAHFDEQRNSKPYDIWKTEIDENNRKVNYSLRSCGKVVINFLNLI